jgi:hypothetical protein
MQVRLRVNGAADNVVFALARQRKGRLVALKETLEKG